MSKNVYVTDSDVLGKGGRSTLGFIVFPFITEINDVGRRKRLWNTGIAYTTRAGLEASCLRTLLSPICGGGQPLHSVSDKSSCTLISAGAHCGRRAGDLSCLTLLQYRSKSFVGRF